MCRLAYLRFAPELTGVSDRRAVVERTLRSSWDMGNTDGVGLVTWDTFGPEPEVRRSLTLDALDIPRLRANVLLHARDSTNQIDIEHTHPFVRAGAYLVHNGVVGVNDPALIQKATTTNDTELILKSYIAADRDFSAAMKRVYGMANVALWDSRRRALTFYPDTSDYEVWRQDGITAVVQSSAQVSGWFHTGLGHPYEHDILPSEKAYVLPLGDIDETDNGEWDRAYARMKEHAVDVRRAEPPPAGYGGMGPPLGYGALRQSYFARDAADDRRDDTIRSGHTWAYDTTRQDYAWTEYVAVGGRKYGTDGKPLLVHRGPVRQPTVPRHFTKAQRKRFRRMFLRSRE